MPPVESETSGGIWDLLNGVTDFLGENGDAIGGLLGLILALNSGGGTNLAAPVQKQVRVREQVPNDIPERRPGSSGMRYFTDSQWVNPNDAGAMAQAEQNAMAQLLELLEANRSAFEQYGDTREPDRVVQDPAVIEDGSWDVDIADDLITDPTYANPGGADEDGSQYGGDPTFGGEIPVTGNGDGTYNPPEDDSYIPTDPVGPNVDPPPPTPPVDPVVDDPFSPDADLNAIFQQVLQRDVDEEGQNFYLDQFSSNPDMSQDERIQAVAGGAYGEGKELDYAGNRDDIIRDIYRDYLGRDAHKGGLDYWYNNTDVADEDLQRHILGAAYGDGGELNYEGGRDELIRDIYQEELGRDPRKEAYDFWYNSQYTDDQLKDAILYEAQRAGEIEAPLSAGGIGDLALGNPDGTTFDHHAMPEEGIGSVAIDPSAQITDYSDLGSFTDQQLYDAQLYGVNAATEQERLDILQRIADEKNRRNPPLGVTSLGMNSQGQQYASGGLASLGGYLEGPGDGMSDGIMGSIDAREPAALSEGEFVIPADVVSHMGNGNSEAGARQLEQMMANIRQARTGNPNQGRKINPKQFMPR